MTLVDAHVHLYDVFQLSRAFDCAVSNFELWKTRLGLPESVPSLLMLAEAEGDDAFMRLKAGVLSDELGRWSISRTGDPISLSLVRDDGEQLTIVAGRQLTTTEGVEVLALACAEQVQDRLPLVEALALTLSNDGMPVLPWGFGKWLGRRGRLVRQILESRWSAKIALGDTSYRPRALSAPRNFQRAILRGVPIYPGTDPLPCAGQEDKIGRYGLVLRKEIDPDRPGYSTRAHLRSCRGSVERYGNREPILPNIRLQAHMQLRKLPGARPRSREP